jgi:phosphoribosyl 1,2-cyclic phosphodiesterase
LEFLTLGSGSRGNAALIRYGHQALLIDLGLGPRALESRLALAGVDAGCISAALLTHTHADHLHRNALGWLAKRGIALYCHEGHRSAVESMVSEGWSVEVRHYDDRPWIGPGGMRIEAIPAAHDDPDTYGFRIELRERRHHPVATVGYLADTGTWDDGHVELLRDVNVLALEFNHDVELQRQSGRPAFLVQRILGERGHLSNDQAAALVARVVGASRRKALRALVMLHMSEQCNRAELALAAARAGLGEHGRHTTIQAAPQHTVSPTLWINTRARTCELVKAD